MREYEAVKHSAGSDGDKGIAGDEIACAPGSEPVIGVVCIEVFQECGIIGIAALPAAVCKTETHEISVADCLEARIARRIGN